LGLLFVLPMSNVIRRNGKRIKASQGEVQNSLSDLSAVTTEALQGVRVTKAFAAESKMENDYAARLNATFRTQIENARITASLRPLVELLGATAVASVLLLCGYLSFLGWLDLGIIVSVIFAFDRINQGLRSFTGITSTLNSIDAATERIHREILDVPDQVEDIAAGQTLPDPKGRIEFRNVSFAYPDGTEALRNVSFTLEPGTSLALVGPSGAGKSTVADLLLRFYDPTEGQILFDGIDVRDLNLTWLREQIGVVPQQTFLFAGSIADNVRLGKPDATVEQISEAGCLAHVDEFVVNMPARYDSPLGEGGAGLSGGQRQRVAIARALVREPALLLLDEATSALDAESERAVTEALEEVMQQRTTLFIAHRLTTAARANRILVMSRGQAIESGTHADLLTANGFYAALFKAFSGGVL
jgi:subfamily B ATP-binding cassette protein MsbA